jgi:hypothetical protein
VPARRRLRRTECGRSGVREVLFADGAESARSPPDAERDGRGLAVAVAVACASAADVRRYEGRGLAVAVAVACASAADVRRYEGVEAASGPPYGCRPGACIPGLWWACFAFIPRASGVHCACVQSLGWRRACVRMPY